ncbi:MAG: hypothetical protein HYW25_04955 [Candidatus Aenigmarchaeota archaeon]|nr:hypothetical protein [Candidatus Aenigmarchaeota archaeon]
MEFLKRMAGYLASPFRTSDKGPMVSFGMRDEGMVAYFVRKCTAGCGQVVVADADTMHRIAVLPDIEALRRYLLE